MAAYQTVTYVYTLLCLSCRAPCSAYCIIRLKVRLDHTNVLQNISGQLKQELAGTLLETFNLGYCTILIDIVSRQPFDGIFTRRFRYFVSLVTINLYSALSVGWNLFIL